MELKRTQRACKESFRFILKKSLWKSITNQVWAIMGEGTRENFLPAEDFKLGSLLVKPYFMFSTVISTSSYWRTKAWRKDGNLLSPLLQEYPNFSVVQLCFIMGLWQQTAELSFLVTADQGYWAHLSFLFTASQTQFGLWLLGWTLSNSSLLTRIKGLQAKFCSQSTCASHMLE